MNTQYYLMNLSIICYIFIVKSSKAYVIVWYNSDISVRALSTKVCDTRTNSSVSGNIIAHT